MSCKEIIGIEIDEMTEISNEIFQLTQKFDQIFANSNLKKVSVEFYLEMKDLRKKWNILTKEFVFFFFLDFFFSFMVIFEIFYLFNNSVWRNLYYIILDFPSYNK